MRRLAFLETKRGTKFFPLGHSRNIRIQLPLDPRLLDDGVVSPQLGARSRFWGDHYDAACHRGSHVQIDRRSSERTEAKNALGSDRKSCVYPRNVRGFRLVQRTEAGKIQLPNETVQ